VQTGFIKSSWRLATVEAGAPRPALDPMNKLLQRLPVSPTDLRDYAFVFILYFLGAKLGLYLFFTFDTSPALIWPPVGIALAAVIFGGYRMWLPIFLAQFLAVITERPGAFLTVTVIAFAYALQAVAGGYLLKRLKFEPAFDKVRNAIIFISAAFLITLIEPVIATAWQVAFSSLSVSPLLNLGRAWGAGIFSVLVLTSFAVSWHHWREIFFAKAEKGTVEVVAAFTLLLVVNHYLFWTTLFQPFGISVIFFLPAVLIWFVLRLDLRWFMLGILVTSIQGIAGSIIAHPSDNTISEQLLAVEIYIGLIAAIFLIFASVVAERRSAYRQLERALESTRAADKAKSEFIAILAHELRNPLAPIVSSLELLKLQPLTRQMLEVINTAEQHTVMIRRLLDDLLDTARLSQKKFELQKERVSAQQIIAESVSSVKDFFSARRHTLEVRVPSEDMELDADPVRVKQAVINLLNNAGKYTEPGGSIELTAERQGNMLCISVRDNGIGIDMEDPDYLFEPFKQAASANRASAGLGIGLFLTKHLVEMHGGSVEARSKGLGKGSVFSIYLPIAAGMPEPERRGKKHDGRPASQSRVLIIDDNEAAASGLQELLRHYDHEAEVLYSGKHALEAIAAFDPHVILLDIGMPGMNGYDVARQIRAASFTGTIVALTGYGQDMDKQQSLEAGFDYHLVKPVGIADILKVIEAAHFKARLEPLV